MLSMPREPTGCLQARLMRLAGTPDDDPELVPDLIVVAQLAARLITTVDCVSITRRHNDGYVSMASSSDHATAAERAQFDDDAGPCLKALKAGHPVALPAIIATMQWPGFCDTALRVGLRSSLSIPLLAGSGVPVAVLNLYSRRAGAMSTLTRAAWAAFTPDRSERWQHNILDAGSRELAAGLIGAVALRTMIQRAIAILASTSETGTDRAYRLLCIRADAGGTSLTEAAALVIEQNKA